MSDKHLKIPQLLRNMDAWSASDLFVNEDKRPAVRRHGALQPVKIAPTPRQEIEDFLAAILTPAAKQRFEETGDLDIGFSLNEDHRFRINVLRQKGKLALVARSLPTGEVSFAELGLPDVLEELSDRPRGLVLVTGATGSGKSTTLAAMLHRINVTRAAHVVTVEDPIEFVHRDLKARISQREVGTDTPNFVDALRHVVRQSPDIILIGEMRDYETMQVALSAALTGHLVFSTLHTIDATQTLQRILSYYPEHLRHQAAMDLSLSLQGIISQRLVPRADGKGRVAATEIMVNTPAIARLLREQRTEEVSDLMRTSRNLGMHTFNDALLELYLSGRVTFDIGRAYATNPDEFALAAQGMRTGQDTFRGSEEGYVAPLNIDLKALLSVATERGASDLHLTVGRPPILRILGELHELDLRPLTASDMRTLLYSILSVRQRSNYELEKELDFALSLEGGARFRVNAYYQKGHMAAALRAIPSTIPDPEALGLPESLLRLGDKPHGLLMVVGPTGAGKSTTLACLVDRINASRACRIITIEDPVEYVHVGKQATIDQREVHADTRSFAAALKYILRQDPDVILIGEMRDAETIHAALTAAETGHLVLATLHSNDAPQTIDRIIDTFPPHQQSQVRAQLSTALLGVVSQRLLPKADGEGRVAAFEIMVANNAIRNLIRDGRTHQAITTMESGRAEGMVTMDKSLLALYEAGDIEFEEAVRFARNPKIFKPPGR
ncbi:MAG: PilT/PilU family type 4a pilus ATPase [Alphaproteobacteria bacterium]|nr:PilT/PilU family type 4a pilus ATPase [Alphaproteobacteria bacterium]MCB9792030.1 PilT/PilU family type 4a pilus ATPase [Alphaproteobacteria bacterium]